MAIMGPYTNGNGVNDMNNKSKTDEMITNLASLVARDKKELANKQLNTYIKENKLARWEAVIMADRIMNQSKEFKNG